MGPIETISILVALLGCFVGLAGWLSGRDKRLMNDAVWRGKIDAKLDTVIGFGPTIDRLDGKLDELTERVVAVEHSTKQSHKRIDRFENKEYPGG